MCCHGKNLYRTVLGLHGKMYLRSRFLLRIQRFKSEFRTQYNTSTTQLKLMKILSHPGHGNSKCCIMGNYGMFQFVEDVSPLIQEASSVLTNWRRWVAGLWTLCRSILTESLRTCVSPEFQLCKEAKEATWMRGERSSKTETRPVAYDTALRTQFNHISDTTDTQSGAKKTKKKI